MDTAQLKSDPDVRVSSCIPPSFARPILPYSPNEMLSTLLRSLCQCEALHTLSMA